MTSSSTQTGGNQIKRIPVKEFTWINLYNLKEAGQSYDELLAGMIQRERVLSYYSILYYVYRLISW